MATIEVLSNGGPIAERLRFADAQDVSLDALISGSAWGYPSNVYDTPLYNVDMAVAGHWIHIAVPADLEVNAEAAAAAIAAEILVRTGLE